MAKGEQTFSTANTEMKKRVFNPIPAGDWDFKLITRGVAEIKIAEPSKNKKTGKMSKPTPRVGMRLVALGSAESEGGRDGMIFHDLFTSLEVGKDGEVTPAMADQLKGLTAALGEDANIPIVEYTPKGTTTPVPCLDARALKKWLEEQDGKVVKGHVKIQAGTKEYPEPKNRLTEFFPLEGEAGEASEEELPPEDGEEAPAEDDAALDELPPEVDEVPARPAQRPAQRPAARPAARPAPKRR